MNENRDLLLAAASELRSLDADKQARTVLGKRH